MPTRNPDQGQLLRRAQDARLLEFHTAQVGTVQSYDSSKHTADVKLACRRPILNTDEELTYEDLPVLPDVPVVALGSSRSWVKTPLTSGDTVLVVFAKNNPAEALEGQATTEPTDTTDAGLSGGFAIPFVLPGQATGGGVLALLSDVQAVLSLLKATYSVTPGDGGAAWQTALKAAATATVLEGTSEVKAK